MKRLFSLGGILFLSFFLFLSNISENEFSYKYIIYANSSNVLDICYMYNIKEKFIESYEKLVLTVDSKYHREMVINNIDNFVKEEKVIFEYVNEMIVVKIGEGRGGKIEGSLKSNICDSYANYKMFIFDLIYE